MNRDSDPPSARLPDPPPNEAWLFAQALLGKPIPRVVSPEKKAQAARAQLEWLAEISTRHAAELRKLDAAEAAARHDRELLQYAAEISTRAEEELRALESQEAEEREAYRRAEQFYKTHCQRLVEWNEADHPREPKGSSEGGRWAPKGGGGDGGGLPSTDAASIDNKGAPGHERSPTSERKAQYVRDFNSDHDLDLRSALKKGKLSVGDISRLNLTDDEIKEILKSAEKPGSDLNLTFYTAENLPPQLRARAEKDFSDLASDEKYAMQAFVSNQRRARTILMARNGAFQQYVSELYGLLRNLNPIHFAVEKGIVVATGKEPVLGGAASRLDALEEMLIYLAVMKGIGWGAGRISGIVAGQETAGDITIAFKGGGTLTIRRGGELDGKALGDAIERAAKGEKVTIDPPATTPSSPSPRSAGQARPRRASLGHSATSNYRKTFFKAHPELKAKVIVHHGIEKQVLTKYPGLITESELHSLENLRGIPKDANAKMHFRDIRKEWNAFYRQHPETATKEDLLNQATEIDRRYGHFFDPPSR